jgi:hypothetical protein
MMAVGRPVRVIQMNASDTNFPSECDRVSRAFVRHLEELYSECAEIYGWGHRPLKIH